MSSWGGRKEEKQVEEEMGRWVALLSKRGKFLCMLKKDDYILAEEDFEANLDHKVSTLV